MKNKPGTMAWIVGYGPAGSEVLNNRAVEIVKLEVSSGFWEIRPLQKFVCTENCRNMVGESFKAGERLVIRTIPDEYLEPWKDIDLGDEIEEYKRELLENSK